MPAEKWFFSRVMFSRSVDSPLKSQPMSSEDQCNRKISHALWLYTGGGVIVSTRLLEFDS